MSGGGSRQVNRYIIPPHDEGAAEEDTTQERMFGVLPEGWLHRYYYRGDFEESYRELEKYDDFIAETFRGHIRSLQFRHDEANRHFATARSIMNEMGATKTNICKSLLCCAFVRDGCLVGGTESGFASLDWIPTNDDSFLSFLIRVHSCFEAMECLGENPERARALLDAVKFSDCVLCEYRAYWGAGLAAAHANLGEVEEALAALDKIVERITAKTQGIDSLHCMTCAITCLEFLGEAHEASALREKLKSYHCHPGAIEVYSERGRMALERSREQSVLLLF